MFAFSPILTLYIILKGTSYLFHRLELYLSFSQQ